MFEEGFIWQLNLKIKQKPENLGHAVQLLWEMFIYISWRSIHVYFLLLIMHHIL